MNGNVKKKTDHRQIDWIITLIPFITIMGLALLLFLFPEKSNGIIGQVRFLLGDTFGIYYLIIGLGYYLFQSGFLFLSMVILCWGNRRKSRNIRFLYGEV